MASVKFKSVPWRCVYEFLNSALDGDVCWLPCCSHLTFSYVVWVQRGRHKINAFGRNWMLVILHMGSQDSKRYPSCFSNTHLIYFEVSRHISLMLQQQFCVECKVISNRYNVHRKCMKVISFQKSKINWNNTSNSDGSVGMPVHLIGNWCVWFVHRASCFFPCWSY
jgi:hypothetical protein